MKKRILSILMCATMCASLLVGCGGKESKEPESKKEEEKVIKVAANGSFFPIIYTDDNGELTGFEHDLLVEIGKKAGYKVEFEVVGSGEAMFEGVDTGKYDTIAGQISVTEEREKKYTFSDVYGYNAIKMAVRGDDPAESVDDLQGRKVCIAFGGVLETVMNEINSKYPEDKQIELVVTEGNIYEELAIGHFDAFPITVLSFDQVNKKGEYDFKLIGDPVLIDKNAFPFVKEGKEEMIKDVNAAIQELHEDGTLSKLSEKYFGRDITKEQITE